MAANTDTDDQFDTLTKTYDEDILDDIEVPVRGDEPPQDLADAVHAALDRTILGMLDGRDLIWRDEGDAWTLSVYGGMPELPMGPGKFAAPYRTMEKFQGVDGSGDGLLDNLPDGWSFDLKNQSTVVFYDE